MARLRNVFADKKRETEKMKKIFILSLWCSVSIFSKTEIYFVPIETALEDWLDEISFPPLYLRLDEPKS